MPAGDTGGASVEDARSQTARKTIRAVLAAAKKSKGFKAEDVIGIGVDTTGSTPLPVDEDGVPLAMTKQFAKDMAAMAWLWKDHTGVEEAAEITALARKIRPQYLAKCGGTYSSEWFFSKILHCLRTSPEVFKAAYTWVELADYVPAALTGNEAPDKLTVGVCAAGHKALFSPSWRGLPDRGFLDNLSPGLGSLRERLYERAYTADCRAGNGTDTIIISTGTYTLTRTDNGKEDAAATGDLCRTAFAARDFEHAFDCRR